MKILKYLRFIGSIFWKDIYSTIHRYKYLSSLIYEKVDKNNRKQISETAVIFV